MTAEKFYWFRMALQLRGSVAPIVIPRALWCGAFGFLISLLHYYGFSVSGNILGSVITNVVFNFVLGLLLVFRTNTAYDRFWEGRKAWGILVVNARNLARQIKVGVAEIDPLDRERKAATLKLLGAFAIATKFRLRREPLNEELERLLAPEQFEKLKTVKSPPLEIALWIGDYLQQQTNRNCLSGTQLYAMNRLLDSFVEALTGCERILNTPIPVSYAIYLKRVLLIYCIFLPLQTVETLHWWTGLIVAIISFVLLGVEEIGNEIENPFGREPNDLPLDEICQTLLDNIEDLVSENPGSKITSPAQNPIPLTP